MNNQSLLHKTLQCASHSNAIAIHLARDLIAARADVNLRDNPRRTPLHYCNDREAARMMLELGANVDAVDHRGYTPLHRCTDVDTVRVLLEFRANPSAVSRRGNHSPLYCACLDGRAEVARVLIDANADLHVCSSDEASPLHVAAINGHVEVVRPLSQCS